MNIIGRVLHSVSTHHSEESVVNVETHIINNREKEDNQVTNNQNETFFTLLEWVHTNFGTDNVVAGLLVEKAEELGLVKASSSKKGQAVSLGYTLSRETGNQYGSYLLKEGTNSSKVNHTYQVVLVNTNPQTVVNDSKDSSPDGLYYIVQLYPNHAPQLIKFGYTDRTVGRRLAEFTTVAPMAKELVSYKCLDNLERTVTKLITKTAECELIGGEVYSVGNIGALLKRTKEVFSLLNAE